MALLPEPMAPDTTGLSGRIHHQCGSAYHEDLVLLNSGPQPEYDLDE